MDLRQLRHFVAIMEHGNMLRAAAAIHVTQPALSKSIRNLEDQLGVKLLQRSPRGVSPTPYGRQLHDHAKLILNQTQKASDELRASAQGVHGHMRVGFGANFAGFMLPQAILKILAARPGVSVSIVSKPFDELLPLLRQGELDLAVVVFPPEPPHEDLVYEPLIISEFRTVCRPDHPLVGRREPTLGELTGYDWALFDRPRTMETLFLSVFLDQDLAPPKPVIRTSSVFFLKSALRQGDFLTFVPPGLFYEELESGSLVILPTPLPPIRIKAGIVHRANDILPASAAEVMEELRKLRIAFGASDRPTPGSAPT